MAVQIQLRRDNTLNWDTVNPILAQGEVGVNLDNDKIKIGDGLTYWTGLTYSTNDGSSGTSGESGTSGISFGTSGTSGTSGISYGTSGTSGSSGIDGSSGSSGIDGSSGTSGISYGTSGTAGSSGIDGSSGTSGIGISGTNGSSGVDGILPLFGDNGGIVYRDSGSTYGYNTNTGLTYNNDILTVYGKLNVNTSFSIGLTSIHVLTSIPKTTCNSAFIDYYIWSGMIMRSGSIISVWDGTNIEYTEISTLDLGGSTKVLLSLDIFNNDIRLIATILSGTWNVKTSIRII